MKQLPVLIGLAIVALIAAPFAYNQWTVAIKRQHDYQQQLEREKAKTFADAAAYAQARLEEEWDEIAREYLVDPWDYLKKHGADDATKKRAQEVTLKRWSKYFDREIHASIDGSFTDSVQAWSAYGIRLKTPIGTYYDW
jgi:hypothetical protein